MRANSSSFFESGSKVMTVYVGEDSLEDTGLLT